MRVVVSGLVNIETTLRVEGFPLNYFPVTYAFGGVGSSVSGVGVNVAKALGALGDEVSFLSLIGRDLNGDLALAELEAEGVRVEGLRRELAETPQSVILYDAAGRRQIHLDLKDAQERAYPETAFDEAAEGAGAAVLCNVNFNRGLLSRASSRGIPVLTDVHVLSDPRDRYNADFMAASTVLFLSDEGLWGSPADCGRELLSLYGMDAVVVGRGAAGSLLLRRGREPVSVPAFRTRPIVSTIGAGDALFSCFAHRWLSGDGMEEALRKASCFASWKIGERGAARGFLDEASLGRLYAEATRQEGKV